MVSYDTGKNVKMINENKKITAWNACIISSFLLKHVFINHFGVTSLVRTLRKTYFDEFQCTRPGRQAGRWAGRQTLGARNATTEEARLSQDLKWAVKKEKAAAREHRVATHKGTPHTQQRIRDALSPRHQTWQRPCARQHVSAWQALPSFVHCCCLLRCFFWPCRRPLHRPSIRTRLPTLPPLRLRRSPWLSLGP